MAVPGGTVAGQKIQPVDPDKYDSLLLAPECKLPGYESGAIFSYTDFPADFPGYMSKWFDYANRSFDFSYIIQHNADSLKEFRDSIIVKFVVTKEGVICHITPGKGNMLLAKPVIKLLQSSPPWSPAVVSSGRNVNAWRTLQIDVLINKDKRMILHRASSYNGNTR